MTHFISNPAEPDDVVRDDLDEKEEYCDRCRVILTGEPVIIEDEIFCQDCANELDAAAENEFDRQKDEGLIEEEK